MGTSVQGILFKEFQKPHTKAEEENKYLSLNRSGLPYKSKIRDSYQSIFCDGQLDKERLDKFIEEATKLDASKWIESTFQNNLDVKRESLKALYFYLSSAYFRRYLDTSSNEDREMWQYYKSL